MGFSLSSRTASPRSKSIWVSGLALKNHRAASTGTSSSRSLREMALPVRLDIRTTSPSRSSFTSCISTMSSRLVRPGQGVHGPLQPGHVAVVVGAPDVDDLVKAPDLELVPVVGDVRGEVGVEAVGPAEHVVLQVQLGDVLLALARLPVGLLQDTGGSQPQGPLLLVGPAQGGELVHGVRPCSRCRGGRTRRTTGRTRSCSAGGRTSSWECSAPGRIWPMPRAALDVGVLVLLAVLLVEGPGQLLDVVPVVGRPRGRAPPPPPG